MVERLAPGVWWLQLGWMAPLGANAFLVDDGTVTLVDAGLPLNGNRIRREVDAAGYAIADIDRVLITHYDLDHVGGLSRIAPDLAAPVYIGEQDLRLLAREWHPPWFHHKALFHRGLRRLHHLPNGLVLEPVADGDRIDGFAAFHTPGHNPGHTAYVHDGLGVGLLGDLVWESDGGLTTPIRLDSYDLPELRASVRHFVETSPPFEVACIGHGTPIREGGFDALRALAATL